MMRDIVTSDKICFPPRDHRVRDASPADDELRRRLARLRRRPSALIALGDARWYEAEHDAILTT